MTNVITRGYIQAEKGGTVVPPSDFQSTTTKCVQNKHVTKKSTRPHAYTRAGAHEAQLCTNIKTNNICENRDCPYYNKLADYCKICTQKTHQPSG